MARADQAPEDRDTVLVLTALVECPACDLLQEVYFRAPEGVTEAQELTEAPTTQVECEGCSESFSAAWEGWTIHDEA